MKNKLRRLLSVCLYMAAVIFLYKGITVRNGGSILDFAGTARMVLCAISVLMVIGATFAWREKNPTGRRCNSIIMIVLVLLFIVCAIAGTALVNPPATEYVSLDLPFNAEDIAYIEMYHYEGSIENVQKKTITEYQSILYLHTFFEDCLLQEKNCRESEAGSVTSFRFSLSDASCYELVYYGYGVKKGYLQSLTEGCTYFTSADIGWNWEMLDSKLTAVEAEKEEVPTMD